MLSHTTQLYELQGRTCKASLRNSAKGWEVEIEWKRKNHHLYELNYHNRWFIRHRYRIDSQIYTKEFSVQSGPSMMIEDVTTKIIRFASTKYYDEEYDNWDTLVSADIFKNELMLWGDERWRFFIRIWIGKWRSHRFNNRHLSIHVSP